MEKQYNGKRPNIPADITRIIEVEAGHQCSIKNCCEHTYLEIHHINQNREDNSLDNLILLCDKHHKMAHANIIDRKALKEYKKLLQHYEPIVTNKLNNSSNFYSNLSIEFGNKIKDIGFQWLSNLPRTDWALKIDEYNKLYSLLNWLNSRDWIVNNSNAILNLSFQKLSKSINLTLKTFESYMTTVNGYYVTEKIYKHSNAYFNQELKTQLEKQYDNHIYNLIDLTIEVAQNFNEVFRAIRKEIDSDFLSDVGIIANLHGKKLV
jgi:hypothetical protein